MSDYEVDMYRVFSNATMIPIEVSGAGVHALVDVPEGKVCVTVSYNLLSEKNVCVQWKCADTPLCGRLHLKAGVPVDASSMWGVFRGIPGGQVTLTLESDTDVGGHISYVFVDA